MRAAGIRRIGGAVEVLELPVPRALRPDEVLIEVRACGAGNWDEFARTGGGAGPGQARSPRISGRAAARGRPGIMTSSQ